MQLWSCCKSKARPLILSALFIRSMLRFLFVHYPAMFTLTGRPLSNSARSRAHSLLACTQTLCSCSVRAPSRPFVWSRSSKSSAPRKSPNFKTRDEVDRRTHLCFLRCILFRNRFLLLRFEIYRILAMHRVWLNITAYQRKKLQKEPFSETQFRSLTQSTHLLSVQEESQCRA